MGLGVRVSLFLGLIGGRLEVFQVVTAALLFGGLHRCWISGRQAASHPEDSPYSKSFWQGADEQTEEFQAESEDSFLQFLDATFEKNRLEQLFAEEPEQYWNSSV